MNQIDMLHTLTEKTGDAFDRAFIKEMTTHHNDAIAMAKLALKNGKRKEIKQLAQNIIKAQAEENEQMSKWEKEWK